MGNAVGDAALDRLRDLGLSGELRRLELPGAQAAGPWSARRPTRKAILGGLFYVHGAEARLRPPIEWDAEPRTAQESRSARYELQTLTWLKEALARHAAGGDVETLAVGRDVVLDWARAHIGAGEAGRPQDAGSGSEGNGGEFAWYDMAVGLRAPYVAYVLRACLAEGMLDKRDAELLREAAERHGAELAAAANYAAANNHGLYQDEGLYLLARLLPELPAASAWRELAVTRMRQTLRETVCFEEGAHLEHSTAYQFALVDLLARLAANVAELPELGPLLERMRRTAAWLTTPGGRMAQLGDTDDLPAPDWARDAAAGLHGLRFLPEAGLAFVRDGDSYLAVTAAYHGAAHKHADDTGFLLIEGGRVLLGDAGRWGYYEDEPDRRYARSAAAHNVLSVDWKDFGWRGAEPYGSGLDAVGEGEGWYAIGTFNPLLARQGVEHRRQLFYRPGRALLVLDRARSAAQHQYLRNFHCGPGIELGLREGNQVTISGPGVAATLTDLSERTEVSLNRGMEEPPHVGWTYPGDRERREVSTATLRSYGDEMTMLTAIDLDGPPLGELPGAIRRLL
jgi:Heparinase II/III-like protein/Heparinase II/III N-terminus